MKRNLFVLLLISLTMFLTGCKTEEENIEQFDFEYPIQITIQKNFTKDCIENENDYREVTIENEEQIKGIIDELNEIQYVKLGYTADFCGFDYIIDFDDEQIRVAGDNLNHDYKINSGNFDFLDNLDYSVKDK